MTTTRTQLLNFDTYYSTYTSGDPFDCVFSLTQPMRNVKKIYFTSLELPIGIYNIRSNNYTNTFTIKVGSNSSMTITLTSAYYASMSTLITSINSAVSTYYATYLSSDTNIPVFSLSNYKVVITLSSAKAITISSSNLMNTVLGFASGTFTSATTFTAPDNYNLSYDSYLNMVFPNLPVNNNSASNQVVHYKIPLTGINGNLYYYFSNSGYDQYLDFTDPSFIISNLRVQILDKFGYSLTNSGLDYSFSLKIEF